MARPVVWVLASIVFALELVFWATGAWAKDGRANGAGQPNLRHAPHKACATKSPLMRRSCCGLPHEHSIS